MITLSIDASTKNTGVAIFNNSKLIHYQCISSSNTNTLKRIKYMTKEVQKIIKEYKPDRVVIQDVLPEDVKHNQNVFKALIYLQASLVLKLSDYNLEPTFYTASHWRAQVGIKTGRGIKRNQLKTASKKLVTAIYKINVNDDISDAICLGMAYIKQHRSAF